MFILEVFLVIITRLSFSLKDDEENNQLILDLAVYRSGFFFPLSFYHSVSNILLYVIGTFKEENK